MIGFVLTIWGYYIVGYLFFIYTYREKEAIYGYDAEIVEKYATVAIKH